MKILYPLAKRFIAGYNFKTASKSINILLENGYDVSIDYVGEMSKCKRDVLSAFKEYEKILSNYKNIEISIKPSQFGLLFDKAHCYDMMKCINALAVDSSNSIRLDMEDSRVTSDTVELAIKHNVGCAIQANHPDTLKHLEELLKNNIPVRLVKGAYKEKMTNIKDIRQSFLTYANMNSNITIATHDKILLNELKDTHNSYEFLYGIRRDIQESFLRQNKRVRIYVPYGKNWLPYAMRRLKEWKNFKFVVGNILKERLNNVML